MKIIFTLCIAIILFIIIDESIPTKKEYSGIVISKSYKPREQSGGTVVLYSQQGPIIGSTDSSSPEKWIIIVNINGGAEPVYSDSKNWLKVNAGDCINVNRLYGYFTKSHIKTIY